MKTLCIGLMAGLLQCLWASSIQATNLVAPGLEVDQSKVNHDSARFSTEVSQTIVTFPVDLLIFEDHRPTHKRDSSGNEYSWKRLWLEAMQKLTKEHGPFQHTKNIPAAFYVRTNSLADKQPGCQAVFFESAQTQNCLATFEDGYSLFIIIYNLDPEGRWIPRYVLIRDGKYGINYKLVTAFADGGQWIEVRSRSGGTGIYHENLEYIGWNGNKYTELFSTFSEQQAERGNPEDDNFFEIEREKVKVRLHRGRVPKIELHGRSRVHLTQWGKKKALSSSWTEKYLWNEAQFTFEKIEDAKD